MPFPNTTFVTKVTKITATWAQAVNDFCYQAGTSIGGTLITWIFPASAAVSRTLQESLQETVSVLNFMTAAQRAKVISNMAGGNVDVTAAINAAIAWARTQSYGAALYFPAGVYPVTEIDASSAAADFTRSVKLFGAGRFMSRVVPFASGGVLLNMMGSNDMLVEDLHFDSTALASQCAIFISRTTTSANANNNKFRNIWTTGSFSVASVVCNGSESSTWFGGRLENTNAAANYRCLWTGGGVGIRALQNITTVNGGTILDTNNPNTDNKMFGVEFYAPFNNSYPVRFSQASSYQFFGCTIIAGSSNNCRLVTYGEPTGGRFNGPISWFGCHFEVFGTGNTVHYLNGGGAAITFDGISSYGGYYVLSNSTSVLDFDRATIAEQPTLSSATWTTPTTSPNSTNTNAYVYVLNSSNFTFKPNQSDGNLFVSGYAQQSTIDVTNYYGGATRFLSGLHTTVATALPVAGTYTVGETIQRETPVVAQPIGWKCAASGTLGTLNAGATTGSITSGSNVLTVSTAAGLAEGQRINVAGSGGPYYIRKLSGTTAYLDVNAGVTVAAAAVSFQNATLVAMANL